jgi:hypothetical protein
MQSFIIKTKSIPKTVERDRRSLRACLGNGGFKWMEENCRGFWEILTYNGNFSTPMPFVPLIPLIPKQSLR